MADSYTVTASKTAHVSESFATAEEAGEAASRLISEGYTMVSIRNIENEGDLW